MERTSTVHFILVDHDATRCDWGEACQSAVTVVQHTLTIDGRLSEARPFCAEHAALSHQCARYAQRLRSGFPSHDHA